MVKGRLPPAIPIGIVIMTAMIGVIIMLTFLIIIAPIVAAMRAMMLMVMTASVGALVVVASSLVPAAELTVGSVLPRLASR